MRKIHMIVIIIILSAANLSGQDLTRNAAFFVDFGMAGSLAPESFDDTWGAGTTVGFEIGYKASARIIPGIFVDFNKFNLLDEKVLKEAGLEGTGIGLMGGDAKITAFGFNARFYVSPRTNEARPYFMIGIGLVKITGSDVYATYRGNNLKIAEWVGDETANMLSFGIGLDIYLSKAISLFADFKYSIAYTDNKNTKFLPVRIGLAFY